MEEELNSDEFISLLEFIKLNTNGIDSMEAMENLKKALAMFMLTKIERSR